MIIEIPNGGIIDLTTASGASETDRIAIESNFDTKRTTYLTLSSTEPTSPDDCEAVLLPDKDSPFCQRSTTGKAGMKSYAMVISGSDNAPVKIRVSVG